MMRKFQTAAKYRRNTDLTRLKLLAHFFKHVPTHALHAKLKEIGRLFDTYRHFAEVEINYHNMPQKPYKRLRTPRTTLENKYAYIRPEETVFRAHMEYPHLVNEFQAAKKASLEDRRQAKRKKDNDDAETANFRIHAAAGTLIECQCCFDDEIPINRAVPCDGKHVHFYCNSCVKNQAASRIGQMQYELNCMFSGSLPCTAPLSRSDLRQVLDRKTIAKLEEMQQNAEIGEADIEGLEECPFCDFKAVCVSADIDREFICGNEDCAKTSCRLCHEVTHIPKSCEEAKRARDRDRGATLRHNVEEAMSDALLRKCPNPKCRIAIIKEYGCNKMVCEKCRTILCYVCGKDITKGRGGGYEHFSVPGAPCKLHDEQEPNREAEQVAKAQKEAINKVRMENPDIDEATLVVPDGPNPLRNPRAPAVHPRHGHLLPPEGLDVLFGEPGFGLDPGALLDVPRRPRPLNFDHLNPIDDLRRIQNDIQNQEQVLNERARAMQARLQQLNQQVGRVFNLVHQGRGQQDPGVPPPLPDVDDQGGALLQDPNLIARGGGGYHFPLDGWNGWVDEPAQFHNPGYNAMPNMDNVFFENGEPANQVDPANVAPAQLALNGLGDEWFNPGVEGLVDNMPQNGHWNPYNL